MQIDLTGKTVRIEGAANPISDALRHRLAECGAMPGPAGPTDLLILSAPLLDTAGFDWDALAETARTEGAAMKARGTGRIVFLLSASAGLPVRRQPDLSMRMAGLNVVMRTLAMSLAPEVAVNALGTGAIGMGADDLCSGTAEMIGHAAVGRAGTVREACDVALFLCDPDNGYLTGQILCADGGWGAGYGRSV
jgi:NAD(P)-dependent dehydrogenase (short-subunit alcohol dehydrogenase family)